MPHETRRTLMYGRFLLALALTLTATLLTAAAQAQATASQQTTINAGAHGTHELTEADLSLAASNRPDLAVAAQRQ